MPVSGFVPGVSVMLPNNQMEPTRSIVRAMMSRSRAAHLGR
jgi:hypothetical protein